ncbi:hypothetical protein AB0A98_41805, partial [Streptomyces chrestomyceticus]
LELATVVAAGLSFTPPPAPRPGQAAAGEEARMTQEDIIRTFGRSLSELRPGCTALVSSGAPTSRSGERCCP